MRLSRWFVGIVALVGVATLVSAQGPRRGFGGFGNNNLFLLSQKSVQDELKLSEEQTKKLTALEEKQREQRREAFQALKDLSDEEKKAKFKEFAERAKETDKEVANILKPEQLKRLKEISLQRAGGQALMDPQVAESLKLSDEQKGKAREIMQGAAQEMRDAGRGEEARKKREEIRKAASDKLLALLSAEQKAKLKELTGAPFTGEIKPPQFRRRPQKQ